MTRKQGIEDARQRIEDLRHYQIDVLGRARDRMNDPDNPPSKEELDRIRKDIEDNMPKAVQQYMPAEQSAAPPEQTAGIELPKLKG